MVCPRFDNVFKYGKHVARRTHTKISSVLRVYYGTRKICETSGIYMVYIMSTRTRINKFDLCAFTCTLRFYVFLFLHAKTVTTRKRDGMRECEREVVKLKV